MHPLELIAHHVHEVVRHRSPPVTATRAAVPDVSARWRSLASGLRSTTLRCGSLSTATTEIDPSLPVLSSSGALLGIMPEPAEQIHQPHLLDGPASWCEKRRRGHDNREGLGAARFAREVQDPGHSCDLPSTVLFGRVKWKRILDGIPSRLATLRYTSACRRYFSASPSTCSGSTACVLKSTIKPSGFPGL